MADTRLTTAVETAVRSAALALLERQISAAQAVALVAATMTDGDPAETPRTAATAARLSRREAMRAELVRLMAAGRGAQAPMLLARRFALDVLDPVEVDSLARKVRRWRREISGHCPVVTSPVS